MRERVVKVSNEHVPGKSALKILFPPQWFPHLKSITVYGENTPSPPCHAPRGPAEPGSACCPSLHGREPPHGVGAQPGAAVGTPRCHGPTPRAAVRPRWTGAAAGGAGTAMGRRPLGWVRGRKAVGRQDRKAAITFTAFINSYCQPASTLMNVSILPLKSL